MRVGVDQLGIEIHQYTNVTGIDVGGRPRHRRPDVARHRRAGIVVNATAGWCSTITQMVGLRICRS